MNTRPIPLSRLTIGREIITQNYTSPQGPSRIIWPQLKPASDLFKISESEICIADEDVDANVRWTVAWLYLSLHIGPSFDA